MRAAMAALGVWLAMGVAPGVVPGAAQAAPLPDGGLTADDVAAVMRSKGYQTEIGVDSDGDPRVRSSANGARFAIYFYECAKTPRCRSIQFTAGFAGSPIGDARVAEWNRTKRFGRAYLDKDGDPWVEMDVDAERGMTTEGLANQFDRWNAVMGSFMRYIGR